MVIENIEETFFANYWTSSVQLTLRRRKKNLHEQCSGYFSFGKIARNTVIQTKEKTHISYAFKIDPGGSFITKFTASSSAEIDKYHTQQQQIEQWTEQLQNALRVKEALEHEVSILKFCLRRFQDNKGIKYTDDLLFEKNNIESFNTVKQKRLINSNLLIWTGLRKSVPLHLHIRTPFFKMVFDLENFKCRNYYSTLRASTDQANCYR